MLYEDLLNYLDNSITGELRKMSLISFLIMYNIEMRNLYFSTCFKVLIKYQDKSRYKPNI